MEQIQLNNGLIVLKTNNMKNLLLILALLFSVSSFGQPIGVTLPYITDVQSVQMTATQTTTSIDRRFEEVQRCINEAKIQVKRINAQESVQNNPKLKAEINQLLVDLQAVMKLNRPKFMDFKEFKWIGDSLQTINEKERLASEILRLKNEIVLGEDSNYIQPQINQLQNRKNDLNKITKSWIRLK